MSIGLDGVWVVPEVYLLLEDITLNYFPGCHKGAWKVQYRNIVVMIGKF